MLQICQSSTADDEVGSDDMADVDGTLKALEEAAAAVADARALVRQAEGQVSTCPLLMVWQVLQPFWDRWLRHQDAYFEC